MLKNINTIQPINIAMNNTKRIIGIQMLVFFLSKKYDLKKLIHRILEWGGASLLLQLFFRNYIKSEHIRHLIIPIGRAGIISNLFGRNIQIWIICDAIAKNMYHYLKLFNFPAANVILCSMAASEIVTNWILYKERLLPSYKKFLDFQGMNDYSGIENNVEIGRYFNKSDKDHKTSKNMIEKIMPNGSMKWIMYHYIHKSIPFYITLHTLQSAYSMKLAPITFAVNLGSSSAFLTAFCYIAIKQGELTLKYSEKYLRGGLLLPGFALILERNPLARRSISHYCMCMALYSYFKDEKMLGIYNYIIGNLTDYNQLRTLVNMI